MKEKYKLWQETSSIVVKNVNIDPEKYSGWAFGMGVDRIALFAYGIPDIRYFYENDLRFNRQFHFK